MKDSAKIKDLNKKDRFLKSNVEQDDYTDKVSKAFDYEFNGESQFKPWKKPEINEDFDIGVIVGSSGSGKSTLLREFGEEKEVEWDNDRAIVSHFDSPQDAIDKLSAVGLNSIPTWCKPFNVLSTGEKFRANLARKLEDGVIIDEFTSVVDRNVAKSASVALSKFTERNDTGNIVLATCHRDVLEWLEPDWVIDTDEGSLYKGWYLQRPEIQLRIFRCSYEAWSMFKEHHYLDTSINKASRCYLATWNDYPVGFASSIRFPNGNIENGWREHRTVVLPDFQGMGIGKSLSNSVADLFIEDDCRYFSRTAHPKFGEYREKSDKWKATSKNKTKRTDVNNENTYKNWIVDNERVCYSHEYIG